MGRFRIIDTAIPGLRVVERQRMGDSRGHLSRLFCAEELAATGWRKPIAQINYTLTHKQGTVRGMHFQHPPHAEMKLVSCLHGRIWDVAVDLRAGSATFLHWHAEELSEGNGRSLLIPEGFAHGFQTLADDCELLYLHSAAYQPGSEGGVNARDPKLAVQWPLAITELSARDASHPLLDGHFGGVSV